MKKEKRPEGGKTDNAAALVEVVGTIKKRTEAGKSTLAIFENEPANSNILQARFPKAASFFVLTQHKPGAPDLKPGIRRSTISACRNRKAAACLQPSR